MSVQTREPANHALSDAPPTKPWVIGVIVAFMTLSFGSLFVQSDTRELVYASFRIYLSIMSSWTIWLIVPGAILTLRYVIRLDNKLRSFDKKWLEWSPFRIKMNIAAVPISVKYIGFPYVVLLLYCLPFLAWAEEMAFRFAVDNWLMPTVQTGMTYWVLLICIGVLWSGLVFGLVHLISFVTIRMTLCLSFAGVVLLGVYLLSDVWVATAFHATYNVIAVAWIMFELRYRVPLVGLLSHETWRPRIDRHLPTVASWAQRRLQPDMLG